MVETHRKPKQKKKIQTKASTKPSAWEVIAEQAQLDFSQYHTYTPKILGLFCNRLQLCVKLIAADSTHLLKGLGYHSCRAL